MPEKKAKSKVEIPGYFIPPQDIKIIEEVSQDMGVSLIEFAQLAPYLYARDYQARNLEISKKLKSIKKIKIDNLIEHT